MSKIPYRFKTPIPYIFFQNGILDPSKKIYKNRLAFLTWAFSQCYSIPIIREGISYQPYEFSFSRDSGAEECGLTENEFRVQREFFEKEGYLEKIGNPIKNRINNFRWNVERFVEEKIIEIEKTTNQNIGVSREENECDREKNHQPNEKTTNQTTDQNSEKPPTDSRVENQKNHQPKLNETTNQTTTSIEQKNNIVLCPKETNKEKVEASNSKPIPSKYLSLSQKEKDLFVSLSQEEFEEHKQTLEAYLAYRNIRGITSQTLARWIKGYSFEDVKEAISLMLDPSNKKVTNPGGWIQTALDQQWPRKERIKKKNRKFAEEFKQQNKIHYLKINQRYCVNMKTEKEFYYHMSPDLFEMQLRNCL